MTPKSRFFAALVIVALFVFQCWADRSSAAPPTTRPQNPQVFQRLQDSLADLNLSDQQRAQIESIFQQAREHFRQTFRELGQMDQTSRRQHIRQFLNQLQDQIKAVLNAEQITAWEKKLQQLRRSAATRPAALRAAALQRLRQAIDQLQLSDDQKAQIRLVLDDLRDKLSELRQQAQVDPDVLRQKARELVQQARQQIQSILTPQQREQLKELLRPKGQRQKPENSL